MSCASLQPRTMHVRLRRFALMSLVSMLLFAIPGLASALTFQVDFRSSTYQVQPTDTFATLLAQHQSEPLLSSNTVTALQGISAPVYAGGVNSDYSLLMTTTVDVLQSGVYTFQVGTDWGRGGAAAVIDNSTGTIIDEFVTTDDIWWANDWNNPDVFTTTISLSAGESYTFAWVGFEGCCGGQATIRFSFNGSSFQTFGTAGGGTYFVNSPEPGSALLVALGLCGLVARQRAARRSQRRR